MASTIHVDLPPIDAKSYDVRVGNDMLASLGETLKSLGLAAPTAAVITDSNVGPLYLAQVTISLQSAGYRVISHTIPAGEQHKTLANVSAVLDTLLNAKVERATPVIALGGGVVGDLAGFVAASLLRGVPFVQVPTTLLAAVDASVGGKVGVDHPTGKNLIGAFHQPRVVITDVGTFRSLPPREIRAGLAECIKHAVIRDASLFTFIQDRATQFQADPAGAAMQELVAKNVAIKAAVVHEDPFEHGVRALLNFGHTFGHAIETISAYTDILHGEAVAIGMVAAARMATALNMFPATDLEELITLIRATGLSTSMPALDVDKTLAAMFSDKKVRAGKLRFVLPTKIGEAKVVTDVPPEAVRKAVESLKT